MSHTTPLDTSTGINQPLVLRKARAATLIFRFWTDAAFTVPYNVTGAFELNFKTHQKSATNLLQLKTSDASLTIDDNEISGNLTVLNSNWDLTTFYYELFNATTGKNWAQSSKNKMITGDAIEDVVTEADAVINIGDNIVHVQLTIAGFDVDSVTEAEAYQLWQDWFSRFSVGQTPPLS